jgi:hypothetical protein
MIFWVITMSNTTPIMLFNQNAVLHPRLNKIYYTCVTHYFNRNECTLFGLVVSVTVI